MLLFVIVPVDLRLGELFCGPGGMALGAMNAQIELPQGTAKVVHAWANDIDFDTCATYRRNIEGADESSVIVGDIRLLDLEALPAIDCLAFGFPCNDFSVVGERKGVEGKFGPLYTYGVKVLEHHQPLCFVAENVGGLSSANNGSAFATILEAMRNAGQGYNVQYHLYKAEEYGVPQRRRRILIVGMRRDLGLVFYPPRPTTKENPPTVRHALIDQPVPPQSLNNELTRQSESVIERLKHIKAGENAFNATLPSGLELNVKGARISQIYRRLDPDQPSYTITGSGGGGTHVYHWEENRALTNRERARLQGFPDDYEFLGSKESVRKQIGMAVPPPLARAIFQMLLETLHEAPYSNAAIAQPPLVMERRA